MERGFVAFSLDDEEEEVVQIYIRGSNISLNEESKRKLPTFVGFNSNGEELRRYRRFNAWVRGRSMKGSLRFGATRQEGAEPRVSDMSTRHVGYAALGETRVSYQLRDGSGIWGLSGQLGFG
ncbi:hypothetical protein CXB51_017999 [Gossypium anomalum]|uniref:Uncharacterized protein n=1 Tax=Gossypium anomalum TaxID=47600 RepID=A0A8J6D1Y7_9ROSI|nr:hypothetical protein CXB51_017999 [Gossypium anomalum]